jgi:hypothetical protein
MMVDIEEVQSKLAVGRMTWRVRRAETFHLNLTHAVVPAYESPMSRALNIHLSTS